MCLLLVTVSFVRHGACKKSDVRICAIASHQTASENGFQKFRRLFLPGCSKRGDFTTFSGVSFCTVAVADVPADKVLMQISRRVLVLDL